MFFDGRSTLAAFIASVSDIDDMIPMLTAYQIEWNKLHGRLMGTRTLERIQAHVYGERSMELDDVGHVATTLGTSSDDFVKLQAAWGVPCGLTFSTLGVSPKIWPSACWRVR